MIEKTVYIADDGHIFENEEECYEYEVRIKFSDFPQSITFFSEDGKIIDCENDLSAFNEALNNAIFVLIPSYLKNERIKCFSRTVMYELFGQSFPTATGLYRWDCDDAGWVSFNTDAQRLNEKWKSMLNITITSERR